MIKLIAEKPWHELTIPDLSMWGLKNVILILIVATIVVALIEMIKRLFTDIFKFQIKEPTFYVVKKEKKFDINVKHLLAWIMNIGFSYIACFKVFTVDLWYINLSIMVLIIFVVETSYQLIKKTIINFFSKKIKNIEKIGEKTPPTPPPPPPTPPVPPSV